NQCLRCCKCLHTLEAELSCYSREGNIYCKDDYYRHFSVRRCARCGNGISASDLVMRAKDLIFHVNCFSCLICGQLLRGGDTAGIRDGRVFCGKLPTNRARRQTPNRGGANPPGRQSTHGLLPGQVCHLLWHFNHVSIPGAHIRSPPRWNYCAKDGSLHCDCRRRSRSNVSTPSEDSKAKTTQVNTGCCSCSEVDVLSVNSLDLSTYDGSQSPGSGGALTPNCRTKRMRTSFKHHQLRTMKSYFAINQNPDAKDLKQLAQKTGLSKRVLQVS
ncbi:AGAP008979-PA, partial [Anopheles gambiae str. PEST]